jgi:hypothetical protein
MPLAGVGDFDYLDIVDTIILLAAGAALVFAFGGVAIWTLILPLIPRASSELQDQQRLPLVDDKQDSIPLQNTIESDLITKIPSSPPRLKRKKKVGSE